MTRLRRCAEGALIAAGLAILAVAVIAGIVVGMVRR